MAINMAKYGSHQCKVSMANQWQLSMTKIIKLNVKSMAYQCEKRQSKQYM
jgi:hypothetical protein